MNFRGVVTKRMQRISYPDWIYYTTLFLKTFDSAYEGTSNIEIKTDVFVPVGPWQNLHASQGSIQHQLSYNSLGELVLKLQNLKLNGDLDEALAEAIPESLFREINSIRANINPNDKTEKSCYAFGQSNFTKKRARHIFYYAQGSESLIKKLREEFTPKSLKEWMLYKKVEGIDRYLEVVG